MSTPRAAHPYHMHDAIYAQPGALRLVTRGNDAALEAAVMALRNAARVIIAGIGSSFHVALVGERMLADGGRLAERVRAVAAADLVSYGPPLDARTAVIVVSHSGTNRFVRETVARARQAGATSIAVTGKGCAGLAGADLLVRTVDLEPSATHTVSYTSALALFAHLTSRLTGDTTFAHELGEVPDHVAALLGQESWADLAATYASRTRIWVVGSGPNTATAMEGALKLQEAAYATAIGTDAEQFLHGTWAACEADDLVIAIAPPGAGHDRAVMAARAARELGAAVLALGAEDDPELTAAATDTIALPALPELLSPIVAVVPLQLFAYHAALARGANPDTMRTHVPRYAHARAGMKL